jgi:hypothetical protein
MADDLLIPATIKGEKLEALKKYLRTRVLELKYGMKELFEEKVTKWNAAYEARPREETRQFPFQNASNLIIPIIGIHTDTLHAQIMAAIFKTKPLVQTRLFGDPNPSFDAMQKAYGEFMDYVCLEPEELDLYRIYNEGFRECIKYGTVTYKTPWEEQQRDFFIPGGDGTGSVRDFIPEITFAGPRPEKLPFTGFYIPPSAKSIEAADFKAHKKVMTKYELEERKFLKIYDEEAIEHVLKNPDRTTGEVSEKERQEKLGAKSFPTEYNAQWDIWECYMNWRYNDEQFAPKMIVTFHEKTGEVLRVIYDNFRSEWFVGARMACRDDMYYGYGFAEILFDFQEGASETYNGFRDNQTVVNTRVWRVAPDSKLNAGYRIYPSAVLPAEKDEIEALGHGELSPINIDDLRLLLDLAERRSGVSPPQQGYGAGVTTGRRGVYTAMGTLALMQEGNSRKDLNVSDMRDAHTRLMRLVTKLYGTFGKQNDFHNAKRLGIFGKKAVNIRAAIDEIVGGRLALPVYASTASVNREVEKQNDLMLSQIMVRHYQMVAQMLGGLGQVMTPPDVKVYLTDVIKASNSLMKTILRNFGHDDVDILVPEPQVQQGGAPNPQIGGQPSGIQGPPLASPQQNPQLVGGPRGEGVQ